MSFVSRSSVLASVLVTLLILGAASRAEASHFRSGNISWSVPDPAGAPRTVSFTVTAAWRQSLPDSTVLDFGDGTSNPADFGTPIGTGVDALGNAYLVTQYTVTHTYATAGTFTAFFEDCCRVAGLQNGAAGNYRIETIVSLAAGNTAGPVSASTAVIQLQAGGVRTYTFPIADADADPTSCRFGTAAETGLSAADTIPRVPSGGAEPTLATLAGGCALSWNLAMAVVGQQYVVHIVIESVHGGVVSSTAIDLIVEVVLPPPPACAGGGVFIAPPGSRFTTTVVGSWSTVGNAALSVVGAPTGAVLMPAAGTSGPSPLSAALSWTPTAGDAGTTHIVQVNYTTSVSGANLTGTCFLTIQVPLCTGYGAACSVGVGECMRMGTNVCAGRGVTVCNAIAGAPAAELCDNRDNDCDGTIDDGNPGSGVACASGLPGVCGSGLTNCAPGGTLACAATVTPGMRSEICNALDDDCDGMTDEANAECAAPQPLCAGAGGCVQCLAAADCDDGIECTVDACTAFACTHSPAAAGTTCSTGVCDGTAAACVACIDSTVGATDGGCTASAPACVANAVGVFGCVACEDDQTGVLVDNGCGAGAPLCDVGTTPACVECLLSTDCGVGTICGPANTCVPGCDEAADCVPTPATPVCDLLAMACVECVATSDCRGDELCDADTRTCALPDSDTDGVSDGIDLDDDDDGVPDIAELGGEDLSNDDDGDGIPDWADASSGCVDADANGRCDTLATGVDADADGIPNQLDRDADGDGLLDLVEAGGADADHDGLVDAFVDANGDGAHDAYLATPLPTPDTDTDGAADYLDVDSDGDGVSDRIEGDDANADGAADIPPAGLDTDGDGIDDAFDVDCTAASCGGISGAASPAQDTDADGASDYRDTDDDGDGVATRSEDANANGDWADDDLDADGVPDYLDARDDRGVDAGPGDAGPRDGGSADAAIGPRVPGGFTGGACRCSTAGATRGSGSGGLWLAALVAAAVFVRRRRRGVASLLVIALCMAGNVALAQAGGFTLDQFRMAETPVDGFAVSRPNDFGHLEVGARLAVDYAHNPLVYESTLGDAAAQSRAVVSSQLVGNIAVSLSLFDRVVAYAGLPVTLWSDGAAGAGWPSADGTAVGDAYLGARARLFGKENDLFALAVQLGASAPLAHAAQSGQSFAGERTFALSPRIDAELRPAARVRITLNVGGRFRGEARLFNLNIGQELTYGLGVTVVALPDVLDVLLETYGATSFDSFFGRETTPLEAIIGARIHPVCGMSLGLAGGGGMARGYGAPSVRGVFEVSYAAGAQCAPVVVAPATVPDADGDGIADSLDACRADAEDLDLFEDADGCPDLDDDRDGVPDAVDGAPNAAEDHDSFEDADGVPDPDNDRDGVLDANDQCGDQAEDLDGMQDADGCPENDVDGDTITDDLDRCPLTPGVPNTADPSCSGCPAAACERPDASPPAAAPRTAPPARRPAQPR